MLLAIPAEQLSFLSEVTLSTLGMPTALTQVPQVLYHRQHLQPFQTHLSNSSESSETRQKTNENKHCIRDSEI